MMFEQPTFEQVEARIAARDALVSHGYDVGAFIKQYIFFEDTTDQSERANRLIRRVPEHPITTEAARQNLPAIQNLYDRIMADGVNLDIFGTIGCSASELGSIAIFLASIAELEVSR